jgi:uncharacterized protein YndB with AHSA1/START domain/DNA-binding transcriptional ArsR family regulator
MDVVFRALNDPHRRKILDLLRETNGLNSSEIEAQFQDITRFGVMKHLKILEAASLVVTRKAGRFKYHYLNASPLQMVVDRWIEPLIQQPLTRAILDLKVDLERSSTMTTTTKTRPDFVMETFIRTTPEKLWEALTNPDMITRYHFASISIYGRFAAGEPYEYKFANGDIMLSGEIILADAPKRLEMSFVPGWMGPNSKKSYHVYEIEAVGELTKLVILHYNLSEEQAGIREGWAKIIASLKTYLETGEPLHFS